MHHLAREVIADVALLEETLVLISTSLRSLTCNCCSTMHGMCGTQILVGRVPRAISLDDARRSNLRVGDRLRLGQLRPTSAKVSAPQPTYPDL